MKVVFLQFLFFLPLIFGEIQLNLYNTNDNDCFRLIHTDVTTRANSNYEIKYYCLSELSSQWKITHDNTTLRFTFDELKQKNITSEQLYRWSTPIDLIEDYQSNTTINILCVNKIGATGTKYLVDGLRENKVIMFYHETIFY